MPKKRVITPEIIEILRKAYEESPDGRDKLWSRVRIEHPEISRRMVGEEFLKNYQPHQLCQKRLNFSISANKIVTYKPRQRLQVDLIDVHKLEGNNNFIKYMLTCIDHFSKKVWVRMLRDKFCDTIVEAMKSILDEIHDQIAIVQSDNGGEFIGPEFEQLLRERNIKHLTSIPHSPWTQGLIEGFNGNFKNHLYRSITSKGTTRYVDYIDNMINVHNNTMSYSHGYTPNDVFYGKIPSDVVFKEIEKRRDRRKKKKSTIHCRVFNIGDNVRLSLDIMYQFMPERYKPRGIHTKSYEQNWSDEIFTVVSISGNADSINGYRVKYNNTNYDQLVHPHHMQFVDTNKLIKSIPIVNHRERTNTAERVIELPPTQMEERMHSLTRTQLRQPGPTLDQILEDISDDEE